MLEESGNAAMKKKLGKRKGYGGVSVEEQITGPCWANLWMFSTFPLFGASHADL